MSKDKIDVEVTGDPETGTIRANVTIPVWMWVASQMNAIARTRTLEGDENALDEEDSCRLFYGMADAIVETYVSRILFESWYRDADAPVDKLIRFLTREQMSPEQALLLVEGVLENPAWPLYLLEDPDGSRDGSVPHAMRIRVAQLYYTAVDEEDAWDMPEVIRVACRIFPGASVDIVTYPYHTAEMLNRTRWKDKSLRDVVEIGQSLVKASGATIPQSLNKLAEMYGFA